ncbi:hypothetical protein BT93_B3131 [Corymbia citriodora subsp. variegata]|nr:hypothetical protein BT93_B3131 [Corymbia citriodora subsp. variegata]
MASTSSPALHLSTELKFPFDPSHRRRRRSTIAPSLSSGKTVRCREPIAVRYRRRASVPSSSSVSNAALDEYPTHDRARDDDTPCPPQLEVQSRIWNWRGYSIRYQCCGDSGPALVLIHGFGANSDHWRKNIPVLGKSHRVYAIDLIGYGYSDKPNPRDFGDDLFYTFETWAAQINDFSVQVVKDKAFFICNSIGGVVGLQAAVMQPQICRGIIILNISLRMLHIKKQPWYGKPLIRSFQNLLRNTMLGKLFFNSVATPESVKGILCQCYHDTSQVTDELVQKILQPGLEPGAVDVFLEFICYSGGPLPEELLPQVKCPVLIAWETRIHGSPLSLEEPSGIWTLWKTLWCSLMLVTVLRTKHPIL